MIRFLPFILIAILIFGGLGYWRFVASKPSLTVPGNTKNSSDDSLTVPKTSSDATIDDRVKLLEDLVTKIVTQLNVLKSSISSSNSTEVNDLNASVTELKARVSALENATPAPVSFSSKSAVYIPLGSGGGPWANTTWYTTGEYIASLDPANYPGYTNMNLEVVFRLTAVIGTASVRLYNTTDSTATSSQVDTTSTDYSLKISSSFTLPTGTKTYKLQVQSSSNQDMLIQSARIKVNF